MQAEFTLPYPPSMNSYWRQWNGRTILSAEGRAYKEIVGYYFLSNKQPKFINYIVMDILMIPPDDRKRDVDNILKPLLDSLAGFLYDDDYQIVKLGIERFDPVKKGCVRIKMADKGSIVCPSCKLSNISRNGRDVKNRQKFICLNPLCKRHSFRLKF